MPVSNMAFAAENLVERLSRIDADAGYLTSVGRHVYWGRKTIPSGTSAFVALHETDEEGVLEQKSDGVVLLRVPYVIEAQMPCDPDHPNEAGHRMVRDIKAAIFGAGMQLAGCLNDIRYAGRTIFQRDNGAKNVVVQVRIEVTLTESLANP